MNPQVNLRPPPTPVSVIKSIIFDKTLQWRVKDGYFELDLRDYLKIQLVLDKKALILYFFTIKDGERWCRLVEIWNIDTFQLRNRTGGELTWLFNHNLDNRLINNRKHLLWHGFCLWQKSRSKSSCRNNRFSDFLMHRGIITDEQVTSPEV